MASTIKKLLVSFTKQGTMTAFRWTASQYWTHLFRTLVVGCIGAVNPLFLVLRYIMGFVTITKFAAVSGLHFYSKDCGSTDAIAAIASSCLAWIMVSPALYTVGRILVPGNPTRFGNFQRLDSQYGFLGVFKGVAKMTSVVAVDLYFAKLVHSWLFSVSQALPRAGDKEAPLVPLPKHSPILLAMFCPRVGELVAWQHDESDINLPTYHKLTLAVMEHFAPKMRENVKDPKLKDWFALIVNLLMWCIAGTPVGHLMTPIGRTCWAAILSKYCTFLMVSLGVWTSASIDTFRLLDTTVSMSEARLLASASRQQVDSTMERDFKKHFTNTLFGLVAPRAVLCMLVPELAVLTVFATAMAGSPLFFAKPAYLDDWLISLQSAMCTATRRCRDERERLHGGGHEEEEQMWAVSLLSVAIMVEESRLVDVIFKLYQVAMAVGILYMAPRYWLLGSFAVFVPVAIAQSLQLVVYLGRSMGIHDDDLAFLCCCCCTMRSSLHRDLSQDPAADVANGLKQPLI